MPNGDWKDKFKWLRGVRAEPLEAAPPKRYKFRARGIQEEIEGYPAEWFAELTPALKALEYGFYPFFTAPGMAAWEIEKRLKKTQEEPLEYPEPMPPTPAREKLPEGEVYEEYRELPWYQQALFELPAYAALGIIPFRAPRPKVPKMEIPAAKYTKAPGAVPSVQVPARLPQFTEFTATLPPPVRSRLSAVAEFVTDYTQLAVRGERTPERLVNKMYSFVLEHRAVLKGTVVEEELGMALKSNALVDKIVVIDGFAGTIHAKESALRVLVDQLLAGKPLGEGARKRFSKLLMNALDDLRDGTLKDIPVKAPEVAEPFTAQRLAAEGSRVKYLSETEEILAYTLTPQRVKYWVRQPGLRQITGLFDKAKLLDNPIEQAKALQGKLLDQVDGFTRTATAQLYKLRAYGGRPKVDKFGQVIDKNVVPLENAPKLTSGKPSMHFHDVIEYADRYTMPAKYRAYAEEFRLLSRETEKMLERELARYGVRFRRLAGEEDWVYLRRVIRAIGEVENVRPLNWRGTQLPRSYGLAGEAPVKGAKATRYFTPEEEILYQLESAYRTVASLRVKEVIGRLTTTAKARVPARVIEDLIDANAHRIAANKLEGFGNWGSIIARAGRGEQIPPQTLAMIRRQFPRIADELEDLIATGAKRQAFTALKKRFAPAATQARATYAEAKSVYQRALQQGGATLEEGTSWYLPGRIFTTQEIAGRPIKGVDLARMVEAQFGYQPIGWFEKVIRAGGMAGAVLRQTKAAFDLSVQGIQTLGALGLNVISVIKAPVRLFLGIPAKPSAAWVKGALRGWQRVSDAIFRRHDVLAWQAKPEIRAIQEEMIRHGALISRSEYAEAAHVLTGVPFLGKTLFKPYEVMGSAFTIGRNATQTYLYMAERARAIHGLTDAAQITAKLQELARFTNLACGAFSLRGAGIGATQAAIENMLMFAPRYTRSVFGLVTSLVRGGYTGKMARDAIAGFMVAAYTAHVFMALGAGQKPRLNPLPESMGGDGAKWLSIKVGNAYIGFGGTIYGLGRLAANIYATASENPDDLFYASMANPVIRFIRGKASPTLSLGVDLITGHDFIGELTRDNLGAVATTFGEWGVPIWAEGVWDAAEAGTTSWHDLTLVGANEFFGGRSIPETDWDKYKLLRELYAEMDYGEPYKDPKTGVVINKKKRQELIKNHPDLAEAEEKVERFFAMRDDEFGRWYDEERDRIDKALGEQLERGAKKLLKGTISKRDYDNERSYIRPEISGERQMLWRAREKWEPRMVERLERWQAKYQAPEDRALGEAMEYWSQLIEAAELPKDWDWINSTWEAAIAKWYDEETVGYIQNMRYNWIERMPEDVQTVERQRIKQIENGNWWLDYRILRPLKTYEEREIDISLEDIGIEPIK